MRWIVGDIQGCAREFDDLLAWIRFAPGRDELWSLGDLVNRGPDSLATLRIWRDIGGRALLGNHDIYALLVKSGRRSRKRDTLDKLFEAEDGGTLLARLRAEPVLQFLPAEPPIAPVWIVHAGVDPRWKKLEAVAVHLAAGAHDDDWLESDDVAFATQVRFCLATGERVKFTGPPEEGPEPYLPWDAHYRGATRIVHGHWAQRGVYRGERTLGLDSGCVYGGSLTAWSLEEDRIVEIPARERGGPVRDLPARRLPLSSPVTRIR